MSTVDIQNIFISHQAILVYEIVILSALLIVTAILAKKRKDRKKQQEMQQEKQEKNALNDALINQKRGN